LIFKETTKSIGITNVKVNILLDNALGVAKKLLFLLKKILNLGTGMGRGYPNPSGLGMRFTFSSPLGMSRVTSKYMRIGYGNGECKTHPYSAPLLSYLVGVEVGWNSNRRVFTQTTWLMITIMCVHTNNLVDDHYYSR